VQETVSATLNRYKHVKQCNWCLNTEVESS
jgi:hypothetical protein